MTLTVTEFLTVRLESLLIYYDPHREIFIAYLTSDMLNGGVVVFSCIAFCLRF